MAKRKSIDKIEDMDNVSPEFPNYYVVLRSGRRVSPTNHTDRLQADHEKNYWIGILQKWPDGTRMEVVTCKNPSFKVKKK